MGLSTLPGLALLFAVATFVAVSPLLSSHPRPAPVAVSRPASAYSLPQPVATQVPVFYVIGTEDEMDLAYCWVDQVDRIRRGSGEMETYSYRILVDANPDDAALIKSIEALRQEEAGKIAHPLVDLRPFPPCKP